LAPFGSLSLSFDDISSNSQARKPSNIKRSTSFNGEVRSKITPLTSRGNAKRTSKISSSSGSIKENDTIKKRTVTYDDDEDSGRSHGRINARPVRRKEDGSKAKRDNDDESSNHARLRRLKEKIDDKKEDKKDEKKSKEKDDKKSKEKDEKKVSNYKHDSDEENESIRSSKSSKSPASMKANLKQPKDKPPKLSNKDDSDEEHSRRVKSAPSINVVKKRKNYLLKKIQLEIF